MIVIRIDLSYDVSRLFIGAKLLYVCFTSSLFIQLSEIREILLIHTTFKDCCNNSLSRNQILGLCPCHMIRRILFFTQIPCPNYLNNTDGQ